MQINMPPAPPGPSESDALHIAVLAAGFIVVFFGFGCYYGFPVYYPALVREFGWTRSQIAAGSSISLLVSGLLSPLVGILTDKRGPRFVIACGALLGGSAMFALGASSSLVGLYISFGLFGIGMSGFSLMVTQLLLAQWFVRHRGFASGLVIAGMGLGGAASPLFVAPLLAHKGWRTGLIVQGAALIVIGVPAILILVRRNIPTSAKGSDFESTLLPGVTYSQALHMPNFWLLAAASFFAMFAASTALQHTVLYLRELHVPLETASRTLSLLLLASVAGRLSLGWLSDVLTRRWTLLLSYIFLTAGMGVLSLRPGPVTLFTMAILIGIGYGGTVVMMTLTAAEIFGLRTLGRILGTIVFCFTAGGAAGPVIVGHLVDGHVSYRFAFLLAGTAAACAGVCAAALRSNNQFVVLVSPVIEPELP